MPLTAEIRDLADALGPAAPAELRQLAESRAIDIGWRNQAAVSLAVSSVLALGRSLLASAALVAEQRHGSGLRPQEMQWCREAVLEQVARFRSRMCWTGLCAQCSRDDSSWICECGDHPPMSVTKATPCPYVGERESIAEYADLGDVVAGL